ncbi:ligand-binding sensor domain-containing diguanylate cyclase [Idiomarina sp.]|uniref:ligand-binding sensor domain-containing protein n=1 Tax=Idiomarina sp. TaxID=1874361 RepID=UPI000C961D18|nr:ligand-binding sensor domain-containing diguanylate cyclase [Idiomarina sp.]MAK71490.1 hypothetical protein [Idiomarinaceae bacterium]HAD48801.1 hypothetical protein [Idiomarina sp.]
MRQVFFFFTVLSIVLAVTSSPRVHAQSDAQYNLPDLADSNSLQHYVRQVWTTREGLPHNSVNAMVQDQSGYLWLGTWQGPTRFNGRDFEIFDDVRVTGLPDIGIYTVALNRCNGSLYVGGARGGISRYDEGSWRELEPAPPFINQLSIDDQCNLWVASSEQGLLFYENDERSVAFTTEHGLPSNAVYQSVIDANDNLWVATNKGLAVKTANSTQFTVIDSVPGNLIRELHLGPDDKLLVGTEQGLYRQQSDNDFVPFIPELKASISTIHHSPDGYLWIGTYRQGVWRYDGRRLDSLNVENGLPNNHVLDIQNDHEGSIWVSTHGGLVQFRDALFNTYSKAHGLAGNYVRAVYQWQGALYVGTSNGVSRIDAEGVHTVGPATDIPNQSVLSLAEYQGNLVIGTYTGGAYVWNGNTIVEHWHSENILPDNEVRQIAVHPDIGIVMGGPGGLTHIHNDNISYVTQVDGLKNNYTTALSFDHQGQLWAGSVSGVVKIALQNNGDHFSYQIEPVDLSTLNDAELVFQIQEYQGYLWFASDRGLIIYNADDDSWRIFNRDTGLPFDNYLSVAFDGAANLWLGTNRGALLIPHDAFTATLSNPQKPLIYHRYTEVDGMSNSQVNSGGPALFRTSDGNLWFATATGVSVIDPGSISKLAATPPPTVIATVTADGETLSYGERVAADTQRLAFDYAGLGYLMSEQIRYQVRLVGFDQDWVNKGRFTTAEYTALPADDYLFQVRAAYPGGEWSKPATFAFSQSEHFWQRPMTWLLLGLGTLLLAGFIVRARLRYLDRSRQRLEAMVKEKTTELEAIARQDPLTGLGNRRAFDERLKLEVKRSARSGGLLSLAIIDVDYFKQVNDEFLHTIGDQVLIELARRLRRILRDIDYAARWGGEEFAVLLPDTGLEQAYDAAERIRLAIERHDFSHLIGDKQLTVSIGVASNQHYPDHSSLLVAADKALYEAKNKGRNRTEKK